MTLRLRLVIALLVLTMVGLAVYGVATYSLYAAQERQRLDDQLRASMRPTSEQLFTAAGLTAATTRPLPGPAPSGTFGGRPPVPLDTWGALVDQDGRTVAIKELSGSTAEPELPADVATRAPGEPFTTGSSDGGDTWRVTVSRDDRLPGYLTVVAVPTAVADARLHQLVLIEATAAAVLLAILAAGSWLILRRGLQPLEHMAVSARSITAGDLSQRVSPSDARTEVGQLGLALNTMLGEIEEAFREREATEARLRQFLADASHELRTPLTSIQGFAELFRVGASSDHVNLEVILRRIEEESARMKSLVEDLLLLARLDQVRAVEKTPVDLAVLAADACSDAVAQDPGRPVTLDAPEPVVISGDQDHLRQAVANLVSNAVRHTPAGSPIDVAAVLADGHAVVSVRDHGPGLDDDALAHVFDRFWQADEARVGTGAGLGLAIVAAIAEEHDGAIQAANAPDGGAVFTLRLPLNAPPS